MTTSAAILAGGRSRRFGSPKHLAVFGGATLLERAIALAEAFSDDVFVVVGPGTHLPSFDRPVRRDLFPEKGPIGGIHAALVHARFDRVAVVPCDLPLLVPPLYRVLLDRMEGHEPVVARSHRGLEPLVSIWPRDWRKVLEDAIASGRYQLLDFLAANPHTEVDLPRVMDSYDPLWFTNVNTPEDLKRVETNAPGKRR
jgi:molybdopterin-guanine dinucleotide biosynthesis protein A